MQFENTTTTKAPIGGAPQGPLDRRMVTRVVLFVEQSPGKANKGASTETGTHPWLQTEGGGEDEEGHSELVPSIRLLERQAVLTW